MSDLPAPRTWKKMFGPRDLKPSPSEPSEYLQLDFIQLPLSGGYQYVLIVCMFPGWAEDFCCKVDAFITGNSLTPCWICFFNLGFPLLLLTKRIVSIYNHLPGGTLPLCLNVKPRSFCSGLCPLIGDCRKEETNPLPPLACHSRIFCKINGLFILLSHHLRTSISIP